MNKLCWIFLLCCLIAVGCDNKKTAPAVTDNVSDSSVVDTTVYGKCGEGTAMHTLELITDKGDTIVYTLEGTDTCSNVQGGLFVGDRLAVIAGQKCDEGVFAKKVINLTSLLGKWTSLDKSFEICEGGVIEGGAKEPKPYTEWKILNGKLILSADTFDIYSLGADSLYLENNDGIYGYKRMSKEAK